MPIIRQTDNYESFENYIFYNLHCIFYYYTFRNKKIVTVFDSSIKEHADYIITKQKLNFHFNDSIYPFTVFVQQNGEFFLRKNFQDSLHPGLILLSVKDSKRYNEKYLFNKDSLIDLYSYFPVLIRHDSTIINHYDDPESFNYKLIYEPMFRLQPEI